MKKFEDIVKDCHPFLQSICKAYTKGHDDFEDLYQEILVQIWKSLPNFRGQSKISTWVYRVAVNCALVFQRGKKKETHVSYQEAILNRSTPESGLSDAVAAEAKDEQHLRGLSIMMAAIKDLSETDRCLILLYLEELSYSEMSEVMGFKINTLGVKLSRAKERLKKNMINRGYGKD